MKKNKWLSIGEFSKLSDVNIKSLRYYDSLGILKPAYVDPESRYRYYSFPQLQSVEAIKLCIGLNIPLKEFHRFYEDGSNQIHFEELIQYGTRQMEKKFAAVRRELDWLRAIQTEIRRAKELRQEGLIVPMQLPQKVIWAEPCEGLRDEADYYWRFGDTYQRILDAGCQIGYECGMLYYYTGREERQYLYVDLEGEAPEGAKNIVKVPALEFDCQKVSGGRDRELESYFPDLRSRPGICVVFETEISGSDYSCLVPELELRYARTDQIRMQI